MWAYRILFAIDALALLVLAYFFVDSIQYDLTGEALGYWALFLGVPAGLMILAATLHGKGQRGAALAILGVMAVVPALALIVMAILIVAPPDFR